MNSGGGWPAATMDVVHRVIHGSAAQLLLLSKGWHLAFAVQQYPQGSAPSVEDRQTLGGFPKGHVRGVAQSGSAPGSGPGGRRFKSSRPDHQSASSASQSSLLRCFRTTTIDMGSLAVPVLILCYDEGRRLEADSQHQDPVRVGSIAPCERWGCKRWVSKGRRAFEVAGTSRCLTRITGRRTAAP